MTKRRINPMSRSDIARLGNMALRASGRINRFTTVTARAAQLLAPIMSQADGKRYGKMGGRPKRKTP